MNWYLFQAVVRILTPPYSQTIQDVFYATSGFAMKAWQAWPNSKLFSYDATTSTWIEVARPIVG